MLFQSADFLLIFLPVTFALWLIADRYVGGPLRWQILIVASLIFYGYFKWSYVALLVASMALNFGFSRLILRAQANGSAGAARRLLGLAIAVNLGWLGIYKYADFAVSNVNAALAIELAAPHLILPLAISFFTFQQIAYLVDVYRDPGRAVGPTDYAFFTVFFPHLIAGPICYSHDIVPQMRGRRSAEETWRDAQVGGVIFAVGLFKKIVLSGAFKPMADTAFAVGANLDAATAWTSVVAYSLHIYFDFSAYSDMAVGLGLLFGIRLPLNFYSPYKATSIIEFWRCWHMTLSRFLRDYLYIPLGGNRHGAVRAAFNLFLVMLLAGLWHGASWTFVVWGGIHGVMLVVNHAWRALRTPGRHNSRAIGALGGVMSCLTTFLLVTVAWIPFRAGSPEQAGQVFLALWQWPLQTAILQANGAALVSGLAVCWLLPNVIQVMRNYEPVCTAPPRDLSFERWTWRPAFAFNGAWAFATAVLIFFALRGSIDRGVDTFIYFQF